MLAQGVVSWLLACASGSELAGKESNPGGVQWAVGQAKEDLARRKCIDTGEIALVAAESVNWPDTSLGCPEPGMMYAQVITPGYRIVLSCAGEAYEYHSDRGSRVVYCPRSSP